MAYVHQISFEITRDMLGSLEIGSPLQRVLGYLRTRLPDNPGFISTKILYSLDSGDTISVQVESIWDHFQDLDRHCRSNLVEEKIREEFAQEEQPKLTQRSFAEVD